MPGFYGKARQLYGREDRYFSQYLATAVSLDGLIEQQVHLHLR